MSYTLVTSITFLWLLVITIIVSCIAITSARFSTVLQFATKEIFKEAPDYERWLKHTVRLFPDGGLALVDTDGIVTECSVGFAHLVNASTTSECIGRSIDSFHESPKAARQLRLSMRQDIVERPVSFNCVDGQCKMVALSVFDLQGIWLVRLVERV
jgi:hypothetical protein